MGIGQRVMVAWPDDGGLVSVWVRLALGEDWTRMSGVD